MSLVARCCDACRRDFRPGSGEWNCQEPRDLLAPLEGEDFRDDVERERRIDEHLLNRIRLVVPVAAWYA
jgi:hypothetical protein